MDIHWVAAMMGWGLLLTWIVLGLGIPFWLLRMPIRNGSIPFFFSSSHGLGEVHWFNRWTQPVRFWSAWALYAGILISGVALMGTAIIMSFFADGLPGFG